MGVVFLGINDILKLDTLDASKSGYKRGLAGLKAATGLINLSGLVTRPSHQTIRGEPQPAPGSSV